MLMTLGEKITELRKNKNLSQIQLAEQLGVSRQAISKWESGNTMPGIDSIIEISNFFDVTIDSLLKDEDDFTLNKTSDTCTENESITQKKTVPVWAAALIALVSFLIGGFMI